MMQPYFVNYVVQDIVLSCTREAPPASFAAFRTVRRSRTRISHRALRPKDGAAADARCGVLRRLQPGPTAPRSGCPTLCVAALPLAQTPARTAARHCRCQHAPLPDRLSASTRAPACLTLTGGCVGCVTD
jgi:hypothetical protein